MKRSTIIALITVLLLAAFALPAIAAVNDTVWRQYFDSSPGEREIVASATDGDGNLIVAGYEDEIIYVAKYRPAGDLVWKKLFGSAGTYTGATDIAVDRDGFIYLVGKTRGKNYSSNAYVRKYGPKGGHHWTKRFGPGWSDTGATNVTVGPGGNIYVLGMTDGDFKNDGRFRGRPTTFVRKYNPAGKFFWTEQFAGRKLKRRWGPDRRTAVPIDIEVGPSGVFVVATELDYAYYWENERTAFSQKLFTGPRWEDDYYFEDEDFFWNEMSGVTALKKFSHDGELEWTRRFGKKRDLRAAAMTVDGKSDVIIVGDRRYGSFTTKFSEHGKRRWTRFWSGVRIADVEVDRGRNIYLVGTDNVSSSSWGAAGAVYPKAYAAKVSPSGKHQWRRAFLNGHVSGATLSVDDSLYVFGNGTVRRENFIVKFSE